MNKRLAISLAAFVGWLLITVVGGQIHAGEAPLLQAVSRGLGWPFLLAALFLLAVVVWQQWRDVGLNHLPSGRSLLLTWLPMLYIVVGLGLAVVLGCRRGSVAVDPVQHLPGGAVGRADVPRRAAAGVPAHGVDLAGGGADDAGLRRHPHPERVHDRRAACGPDPVDGRRVERSAVHRPAPAHRVAVAAHHRARPCGTSRPSPLRRPAAAKPSPAAVVAP